MLFTTSLVPSAFALAFTASHLGAQSADPSPAVPLAAPITPATDASSPALATSPAAAGDLLSTLGLPSWLVTGLSIFATVSIAYQGLIAFAHKRAAETATPADDQWIASLEAKTWFRILIQKFRK